MPTRATLSIEYDYTCDMFSKLTAYDLSLGQMDSFTIAQRMADATDDLPILSRVEFAKNLIFDHGGDRNNLPQDPILITAVEVLSGVIQVLRANPTAASLRSPEP
jgi:hypothetical protein